ncbi:MAG: hypothetical protein WAS21_07115 [Geminicoccaceae bacterium]
MAEIILHQRPVATHAELAAMKFDPVELPDRGDLSQKIARANREIEGYSFARAVMAKNDEELSATIADRTLFDTMSKLYKEFIALKEMHAGASELFEAASVRLLCAMSRACDRLEPPT